MKMLLIFNFNGWEIPLLILVVLILFGGKKYPEFMRGLGKGINSFKKGLNDMEDEIKSNPDNDKTENKQ